MKGRTQVVENFAFEIYREPPREYAVALDLSCDEGLPTFEMALKDFRTRVFVWEHCSPKPNHA